MAKFEEIDNIRIGRDRIRVIGVPVAKSFLPVPWIQKEYTLDFSNLGGGSTYTAGPGISIDNNNVISNTSPNVNQLPVINTGTTAPAVKKVGDIWHDTSAASATKPSILTKTWNGSVWFPTWGTSNLVLSLSGNQLSGQLNGQNSNAVTLPAAVAATGITGDTKHGYQATDHSGWIRLDGRALSTLTATQQTQATALGFSINLPDTRNKFVKGSNTANNNVGSTGGTNAAQATLTIQNIPQMLASLPDYSVSVLAYTNVNGGGPRIQQGGNSISGTSVSEVYSATPNSPFIQMGSTFPQPLSITVNPEHVVLNHFVFLGN